MSHTNEFVLLEPSIITIVLILLLIFIHKRVAHNFLLKRLTIFPDSSDKDTLCRQVSLQMSMKDLNDSAALGVKIRYLNTITFYL